MYDGYVELISTPKPITNARIDPNQTIPDMNESLRDMNSLYTALKQSIAS